MKLGTVFLTIFTLTISNIKFIHLEFLDECNEWKWGNLE